MSRKRYGWASLIALLILAVMLVVMLVGCGPRNEESKTKYRFTVEEVGESINADVYLITEKETGKQWVYVEGYKAGGLVAYE